MLLSLIKSLNKEFTITKQVCQTWIQQNQISAKYVAILSIQIHNKHKVMGFCFQKKYTLLKIELKTHHYGHIHREEHTVLM